MSRKKTKNYRKFVVADRVSFICFALYVLTYVVLLVVTWDYRNLIFLFIPLLFSCALLVSLALKSNKVSPQAMSKVAKVAADTNLLLNGADGAAASLLIQNANWNEREKEIKRLPSIVPAWLFAIFFLTPLVNFTSYGLLEEYQTVSPWQLLWFSAASLVFILMAQISSTFALIYAGEKIIAIKSWVTIVIFLVLVTVGTIITYYLESNY